MNAQQVKSSTWFWLKSTARSVIEISAALTVIVGFLSFLNPIVQPKVQTWLGMDAVEIYMRSASEDRAQIRKSLEALSIRLDEVAPARALHFTIGSVWAAPVCEFEQPCKFGYEVRRTRDALNCPIPQLQGRLINHNGSTRPVPISMDPVRLDLTETILTGTFQVSSGTVRPGPVLFYVAITYDHCLGNSPHYEHTPYMNTILETPSQ